ncbi:TetR family transcriptional regulator [Streptomyces parvulus]|uniref:TetR family transcriptional regulator n=1 Tax=Streptomyces parvulus TaxID=146923 RepID=A0A191V6T2_9ACTN|nr:MULTISPECIES: TetR family transcriptional regulator [Streptomyces]ANJ10608.1 TetR family transcriptional regulator [Streptomyces parvulus]MCC9155340.1 TetR family transcriptional regulator [Streptomyces parvulus]MCE7687594.1 TetR family transcriptional regulator [Streptomyces parvulus]MZD52752.1 TetR family transcriptional regulator [Streptomyces sp. SID5606]WHM29362.1 TetR family transcriptional regulator [Streptomyces sp. BPPL-273]
MESVSDMRERGETGHEQAGTTAGTAPAAGAAAKHAGGRRPGETRTREAILGAARVCFAERGFDGTSLRRIAETAGVDQALVHHFYGTKESLFLQALELPGRIQEAITAAARGERAGVGERMVRAHLSVWDDVSSRPALMTMVRSAAIHRAAAARLRETATGVLARALGGVITGEDAMLRTSMVATQLVGLAMMRYVAVLEPLSSADTDTVVRYYGRALQAVVDD